MSPPGAQDHPLAPGQGAGTTTSPLPILIQKEAAGSPGPGTPGPQRSLNWTSLSAHQHSVGGDPDLHVSGLS